MGWVDMRKPRARLSLDDEMSSATQTGVHVSPPSRSSDSQDTIPGAFGALAGRQLQRRRASGYSAFDERLFCTWPSLRAPSIPALRGYVERRCARWVGLICASREHASRSMMRCPRRPKQVFMCHHQVAHPTHRTRFLVRLAPRRVRQQQRRRTSSHCALQERRSDEGRLIRVVGAAACGDVGDVKGRIRIFLLCPLSLVHKNERVVPMPRRRVWSASSMNPFQLVRMPRLLSPLRGSSGAPCASTRVSPRPAPRDPRAGIHAAASSGSRPPGLL